MRDATYRIIRFPTKEGVRHVGVAWNYEQAVLLSTQDFETFGAAQAELTGYATKHNVNLKWFDGCYQYNLLSGQLEICD